MFGQFLEHIGRSVRSIRTTPAEDHTSPCDTPQPLPDEYGRSLTLELGVTVRVYRMGRIEFRVRALLAVKNIIR
jgi:hypothetical protein